MTTFYDNMNGEVTMKAKSYYKLDTSGDTLKIAKEAKAHQQLDHSVINGTVGSLYDETHTFYEYEAVKKAIKEGPTAYPYTSSAGDPKVSEKWLKHIFGDVAPTHYEAMITHGGTGALSLALDTYLEPGDIVLSGVPDWNNYINLVEHGKHEYVTFPLFNEKDTFNVDALNERLHIYKDKRIMIFINDPAQNPTGYSMDQKIWASVLACIHKHNKKRNIALLIDLAYVDYADEKTVALKALKKYENHVLTLFAISGSKSFSLYGARIGMLAALTQDANERKSFKDASLYAARGTYSLPSNFGMNVLLNVFKDIKRFQKELHTSKRMLQKRSEALKALLDKKKMPYYPQHDGFFITLITKEPYTLFHKLKAKKIYTIPVEHGVRIAISSISLDDITHMSTIL